MTTELQQKLASLTPQQLATLSAGLRQRKPARPATVASTAIPRSPRPAAGSELSFAQERMWVLNRMEPGSARYVIHFVARLEEAVAPAIVRRVLHELCRRHESLRTTFGEIDGRPIQKISDTPAMALSFVDLSSLPDQQAAVERDRLWARESRRSFDLIRGPLTRVTVVLGLGREPELSIAQHHIISDGGSVKILVEEFEELCEAYADRRLSPLAPLPIQYADFAAWQRQRLQGEAIEQQLAYWCQELGEPLPECELPIRRGSDVSTGLGRSFARPLPEAVVRGLRRLTGDEKATLLMTVQAGLLALLARYSGQHDLAVGMPTSGRRWMEVERLVGFFVNTLVVRCRLTESQSFRQLVRLTRDKVLGALAHQDLPFDRLVQELQPDRSAQTNPFFRVMVTIDTIRAQAGEEAAASRAETPEVASTVPFDLTLGIVDEGHRVELGLAYPPELFHRTTIRKMSEHLHRLLASAVLDPDGKLAELPLMSHAERHQTVVEWNEHQRVTEPTLSVMQLFRQQVARRPSALAVAGIDRSWTYAELAARVDAVASQLRHHGVTAESPVAILMDRSPELLASILGTVAAGGAYLPLDPTVPMERIAFMVEDAAASVLLTESWRLPALPAKLLADVTVLTVDEQVAGEPRSQIEDWHEPADLRQLAYVIYTSGSTGRPKGVAVSHRALLNLVRWHCQAYEVTAADRSTLLAGLAFDASVWEIWPVLTAGASLHLPDEDTRLQPLKLARWLAAEEISLSFLPTPLAEEILDQPALREAPLRALLTGGDRLRLRPSLDLSARLVNHYGPTENAVVATATDVSPVGDLPPTIGRPLPGVAARVLDPQLRQVLPGAIGELTISGVSLARGYLNRAALTAAKFVPDPLAEAAGGRLYRSGDLVRHDRRGELEFLGRIDHQVKIRGFRIELGEIEQVLAGLESVAQAVVDVWRGEYGQDEHGQDNSGHRDSPAQQLVAWVVPTAGAADNDGLAAQLRDELLHRLPSYMVPTELVFLDALPKTANGKIDRKALPSLVPFEAPTIAPRNPNEEILVGLWRELLGRPVVGVHDDFFALGGYSLLAVRMLSRVRDTFRVEVGVAQFFQRPTVADLATAIADGARSAAPPLLARGGGDAPLSFAQQRLWFLQQLDPTSTAYNMSLSLVIRGPLVAAALERTLLELVHRHAVLRTTFPQVDGSPMQRVSAIEQPALPRIDLRLLTAAHRQQRVMELANAHNDEPFVLEREHGLRLCLLQVASDEHILLVSLHHILSDGWSVQLLEREILELYAAFSRGLPCPLSAPTLQYADYAAWQREWLQGEVLARQLDYWRRQLDGASGVLELPTDHRRPPVIGTRSVSRQVEISSAAAAGLRRLVHGASATVYMGVLTLFEILLYRYTGQRDPILGMPVANRGHGEVEGMVGLFVNLLPLRVDLGDDPTVDELLAAVRQASLAAYAHQDVPFEMLLDQMRLDRDLSRHPLCQAVLNFDRAEDHGAEGLADLDLTSLDLESRSAKFDWTMNVVDDGELLGGVLKANAELFEAASVERAVAHWRMLLEAAVRNPERRVSQLPLLDAGERAQLLSDWQGAAATAEFRSFPDRFAAVAARQPTEVALVCEGQRLTFGELDRRANALAHRLAALKSHPERTVGLCARRSIDMVVGTLGILKSASAYLPIDPDMPAERQVFMLRDAGAVAVVCTPEEGQSLDFAGERVLLSNAEAGLPPALEIHPESLSYVIYTSGSTGQPKGAMLSHRSLANYVDGLRQAVYPGESRQLRVGFNANVAFDASFKQLAHLLWGYTLYVLVESVRKDVEQYVAYLREHRLQVIDGSPSQLRLLLEAGLEGAAASPRPTWAPEILLVGGEAIEEGFWDRLGGLPATRFFNHYGPTECTVNTTICPVQTGEVPRLGRPIFGLSVQVVDRRLRLAPVGIHGELVIGGNGPGRGYLGRPAQTAAAFVPDPFSRQPGARLYRSGDLGFRRADGDLVFVGRIDHQIKLRGFRVEPGEIEAALELHPSVTRAAVVPVRDDRDELRLVAYAAAPTMTPTELRTFLGASLPDFMVPSTFVVLDTLPLNANGKVDRRALPEPEAPERENLTAPRTPEEEVIAGVWSDVLGLEQVGIEDDFFELGGHSLLATRIISRIRSAFEIELPLQALFEGPTVAELAQVATAACQRQSLQAPPLQALPRGEDFPLSFAQERLWFLDQLNPGSAAYNVPIAHRFCGAFAVAAFAAALDTVVARHEILRTVFPEVDGEPVQRMLPELHIELPVVALSALTKADREREMERLLAHQASQPFDLAQGPLLRALLVRLAAEDVVVAVSLHHIVSDAWSSGLLIDEIERSYASLRRGEQPALPALPLQYADFSKWQRDWLRGEVLERHLAFWTDRLEGAPQSICMPVDRRREEIEGEEGASELLIVPPTIARAMQGTGRRYGVTLFVLGTAALVVLLRRLTGRDDLVLGTNVANRNRLETEGVIGFFVNQLVLRIAATGDSTFRQLIDLVHRASLDAFAHQDLPFEKVVEAIQPDRKLAAPPWVEVKVDFHRRRPEPQEALLDGDSVVVGFQPAHGDLLLQILEGQDELELQFLYRRGLFLPSTVKRYLDAVVLVLKLGLESPDIRLGELGKKLQDAENDRLRALKSRIGHSQRNKLRGIRRR